MTLDRLLPARAGGLLALVALAALAGCSGADTPAADPPAGTGGGATPGAVASSSPGPGLPKGVKVQKLPAADSIKNDVDLRQAVTLSTCAATTKGKGWAAKGTVSNTGKEKRTYAITVFFTTSAATVVASAETKVSVGAGKSEKWTASKEFPAGDKLLCVLRGVG